MAHLFGIISTLNLSFVHEACWDMGPPAGAWSLSRDAPVVLG